jgi:hypothetical protein
MRGNDDLTVGRVRRRDAVEQQLGREASHLGPRPADGRQGDPEKVAVCDVARSHHRDVLRHAQPGLPDRLHRADRRRIVGGEYRVHARSERQQGRHGPVAVRFHEPAADHQLRAHFDPVRSEGLPVSALAPSGMDDTGAGDVRDLAASEREQVVGRQPPDLLVIGQDAVAPHVGVIVAVEHDERRAVRDELTQDVGVPGGAGRGNDDPVDLPLPEHREFGALLAHVLAGGAKQHAEAAGREHRLHAGNDLDEKRVHQVRDDDADRGRAAEREAAGDRVGAIAELLDLGEHARARLGADVVVVVDHLRDGRDGHAQLAGNPLHRRGHGATVGCDIDARL